MINLILIKFNCIQDNYTRKRGNVINPVHKAIALWLFNTSQRPTSNVAWRQKIKKSTKSVKKCNWWAKNENFEPHGLPCDTFKYHVQKTRHRSYLSLARLFN